MTRRVALPFLLAAAVGSCSEGPGTIELTLNTVPGIVQGVDVLITGTVTRTPAKATDVMITATGGSADAADTTRANTFEVRVLLKPNVNNAISITATDAQGSTSNTLTKTVLQDAAGPSITQATPADVTDAVALGTSVAVTFTEAVIIGSGGGIRLTRQGVPVTGTTTRSADSLTLTFAPAAPLSPNAVYRVGFTSISDVAANAVPSTMSTCFVTTTAGAAVTQTFNDLPGDTIYSNSGADPNLLPPDLVSARFAREGSRFSGIFQFVGPRIFSPTALNQGGVILELDTDQDSLTGVWTIKDTLFSTSPSLGPTYSSGTLVEQVVDLEPFPVVADSAVVGPKLDAFSVGLVAGQALIPGTCGPFMAFVVPFSFIGNDDGKMNAVIMGVAATTTSLKVDPFPVRGHIVIDLPAPPGLAPPYTGPAIPIGSAASRATRRPLPPLR